MATQGESQRPKSRIKTTHSLASPFPEPSWPQTTPEDQHAVVDLLCLLLEDIGHFRRSLPVTKGKRSERKRKEKETTDQSDEKLETLPRPEIESSILIGFNDVQRRLESMTRRAARSSIKSSGADQTKSEQNSHSTLEGHTDSTVVKDTATNQNIENPKKDNDLIAVFVDRSSQPPIMTRQLPDMMAVAAVSTDQSSMLWLIALPNGAGARLAEAVGIPRVGFCGVLADAPGSNTLLHYLRSHIQPIQPLAADAAALARFLPLKVDTRLVEVEFNPPGKRTKQQNSLSKNESELRKSKKRRRKRLVTNHQAS